jgi:hypothetical protein
VRVSNPTTDVLSAQPPHRPSITNLPYWLVLVVRALPAAVIAAVITFSADHSVGLGLVLFAIFAVSTGVIVLAGGVLTLRSRVITALAIAQGVVAIVVGVVAGFAAIPRPGVTIGQFIFLLVVFASLTGFLELYAGLRSRGILAASRDWVFLGSITAAFAVALLFIPLELRDPVRGQNGIEGFLTAPVVAVGLLGAHCAIVAVYLVIAGLSLKWAPTSSAATAAERVE